MRTGTGTQQDGAAQAPALMAQARPVAAAAALLRAEQVEATPRRADEAQAGEAPVAQEQAAQEQAAQVTREVTWRHCMATAPRAERAARRPAGPVQAAQMVEVQVEPAPVGELGLTG